MAKLVQVQVLVEWWEVYFKRPDEAGMGTGVNSFSVGARSLLAAVLYRAVADLINPKKKIRVSAREWFFAESAEWDFLSFENICNELDISPEAFKIKLTKEGLFPEDKSIPVWMPYDMNGKRVTESMPKIFRTET